ncbi:acetamidase [Virgibacillus dakarensis]|uniref:Acetamidase n=1 Tax=Lentibacillus populi TaxID=1827502 RepID=A0A9W5TXU1_9BACI|nr:MULTISPECIES: acetamidase/formamidase family protein [Bacillaceae]MTW85174.1 acetamidase [Virgibacillus dakarensis]GGB43782.1 acetamidase [Lentibacillus populi]
MQKIEGNYIYAFSKSNDIVGSVNLNESFIVETLDCYSGEISNEKTLRSDIPNLKINPATGPIYINGINKGDTISIEIIDIKLNSYGVMVTGPNIGMLGDYISESQTRILPIEGNKAILNNSIKIPINKMIGVIGVAPENNPVPCSTPGEHGGNMDTKDITEGNKLHLPIFHDGGLLALGDLHAAMGDGELDGTGVEIGGEVTLKVRKNQNTKLRTPIVETADHFMIISSAKEFKDAVRKGMLEAVALLQRQHNLEFPDAYRLVSAVGELKISQLVNPKITIRIALPKTILNTIS